MKTSLVLTTAILSAMAFARVASAGSVRGTVSLPAGDMRSAVVSIEGLKADPANGARAVVNQRDLKFIPYVLPIVAGTTVEFENDDPVYHNVFSNAETATFKFGIMKGQQKSRTCAHDVKARCAWRASPKP